MYLRFLLNIFKLVSQQVQNPMHMPIEIRSLNRLHDRTDSILRKIFTFLSQAHAILFSDTVNTITSFYAL